MEIQCQNNSREDDEQVSDSESCIINDKFEGLFGDYLNRLNEDDVIFDIIGHKFLSNLVNRKKSCATIEAIHKMNWSITNTMFARLQCFNIFRVALLENNNNNYDGITSCMKYAWYCGSKEEIQRIVSHGFGHHQLGARGDGICLSPLNSLAQSVQNCVTDDDGLKHVLLCRVLLENGKSLNELTFEVDDDVMNPKEYVVWSTKMNTHILPDYVVTFRTIPCLEGIPKAGNTREKRATSPWLPFTTLMAEMSKFLPPQTRNKINKYYKDFKDGKISRQGFVERLKECVGKEFLLKMFKFCRA